MSGRTEPKSRTGGWLLAALALALLAAACTSSDPAAVPSEAPETDLVQPSSVPPEVATAVPVPTESPEPATPVLMPALPAVLDAEPVAFGTYAVAKPGAGMMRSEPVGVIGFPEIPVYDAPSGPERALVDKNLIDGVAESFQLINSSSRGGALVLRVFATSADSEWLLVQVPVRPNNSYAWVQAEHFDLGQTSMRIEVDLAQAKLTLFDGDEPVLSTLVVHGKESRPTPTHIGFIENGVAGKRLSPAYGLAALSMSSFSENLGTFGGGNMPTNFLHGTNEPGLVGNAFSSGSIRVPDDVLAEIIELVTPGAPVLLHDGDRAAVLADLPTPALTMPFAEATTSAIDGTSGFLPQLWRRCSPGDAVPAEQLLCRSSNGIPVFPAGTDRTHVVAVAKEAPQDCFVRPSYDVEVSGPPRGQDCMIPVYDELGSDDPRVLEYQNAVDRVRLPAPLYAETIFGESLRLSVVELTPDGDWLRVRAPVRPHDQTVWVRGSYFELESTTVRIEVDIGTDLGDERQGLLSVYDDDRELLMAGISAGRQTRPTTLTSTFVDQIIPGPSLSPAYGPAVFSTASFSEVLGTFGGSGVPTQSIHALPDELWAAHRGVPQSSGSIHVSMATMEKLAEIEGILGARVIIYDSRNRETGLGEIINAPLTPATTTPIDENSFDPLLPSFT